MVCSQNSLGRAEVPTLRRPPMLATCIVRSENVQTTRGSSRSRPRPALCLPVLVSSHRLQDPPNSAYMLGSTSAAGDGLRRLPCFCLLPVSRSFAGRRPCPQTCALPETRSQRRSTRGTNYSRGVTAMAAPAAAAEQPQAAAQSSGFQMVGQCFACICPFKEGTAEVDKAALDDYLKFLWASGGRNIVINGTTGEFAAMSTQERKDTLEAARASWPTDPGGVLMNNVSSCSLAEVYDLLEHSQQRITSPQGERTLADAVLVLPPYYLAGVPEAGIASFLRAVLGAAKLPVFLYNFPANTNSLISPELYGQLAREFPQLRGIKNTFEDTPLAKKFKEAAPQLQVYIGSDKLSIATLDNGMDGVIGGGGSSILASLFVNIWHAYKAGDKQRAQALQDTMDAWTAERERTGIMDIPAGKAGLHVHLPRLAPTCRAPVVAATPSQQKTLDHATSIALEQGDGAQHPVQ